MRAQPQGVSKVGKKFNYLKVDSSSVIEINSTHDTVKWSEFFTSSYFEFDELSYQLINSSALGRMCEKSSLGIWYPKAPTP